MASRSHTVESERGSKWSHYQHNCRLPADLHSAYQAVTTQQGIAGWWTQQCEIVDNKLAVHFGDIDESFDVTGNGKDRVQWYCTHMYWPDRSLARTDEWVGTTIVFTFASAGPDQTNLLFEHRGLTPQLDCWKMCKYGWDHFLASLEAYLSKGKGHPYKTTSAR